MKSKLSFLYGMIFVIFGMILAISLYIDEIYYKLSDIYNVDSVQEINLDCKKYKTCHIALEDGSLYYSCVLK